MAVSKIWPLFSYYVAFCCVFNYSRYIGILRSKRILRWCYICRAHRSGYGEGVWNPYWYCSHPLGHTRGTESRKQPSPEVGQFQWYGSMLSVLMKCVIQLSQLHLSSALSAFICLRINSVVWLLLSVYFQNFLLCTMASSQTTKTWNHFWWGNLQRIFVLLPVIKKHCFLIKRCTSILDDFCKILCSRRTLEFVFWLSVVVVFLLVMSSSMSFSEC